MKLLVDLFPVLLFFAAFKLKGIFVATVVAMVASVAQIGWMYARHRKIEPMMWLGLVIITVFGGATLLLRDETFIKWKPTVLYWLFAVALTGGRLFFGKNAIRELMAKQLTLPEPAWNRLNTAWAGFFAVLGGINLFVAYTFSTDIWVNFKLFGIMGLILLFVLVQGALIAVWQRKGS